MKAKVYPSYKKPEIAQVTDVSQPIPKDNNLIVKANILPQSQGLKYI